MSPIRVARKNMIEYVISRPLFVDYKEYIVSPKWYEQREIAFKRDGYKCRMCGATENLEGHHIGYELMGTDYDYLEVQTLCHSCHTKVTAIQKGLKPEKEVAEERTHKKGEAEERELNLVPIKACLIYWDEAERQIASLHDAGKSTEVLETRAKRYADRLKDISIADKDMKKERDRLLSLTKARERAKAAEKKRIAEEKGKMKEVTTEAVLRFMRERQYKCDAGQVMALTKAVEKALDGKQLTAGDFRRIRRGTL